MRDVFVLFSHYITFSDLLQPLQQNLPKKARSDDTVRPCCVVSDLLFFGFKILEHFFEC